MQSGEVESKQKQTDHNERETSQQLVLKINDDVAQRAIPICMFRQQCRHVINMYNALVEERKSKEATLAT